jgi:chemotaxis regulatin CheY-phosphate phosphatase CheZ
VFKGDVMNDGKNDIELLGSKLEELKSLFSVGEKLVPGIQSLVNFIKEMAPLLIQINNSIEESNAKIPKATDHIVDVTNATEMATTEILDLIDVISGEAAELTSTLNEISERETEGVQLLEKLKDIVGDNKEAVEIIEQLPAKFLVTSQKDVIGEKLDKIQLDVANIAIALQVQDITTQQLSAVNHLIISVQKRLAALMFELSQGDIKHVDNSDEIIVPTDSNFDMNASFIKKQTSQDEIDKLINSNAGSNDTASQDEIDKLINDNNNSSSGGETASQDEIDKLFG